MKQTIQRLKRSAMALLLGSLLPGCTSELANKSENSDQAAKPSSKATPVMAPAWQLKDLDGRLVSSTNFAGKVIILDFWATWCPPCRQELPGFVALQNKYGADGLVVIGVDVGPEDSALVKTFAKNMGLNYPIVFGDEKIAEDFGGIEALPTTFTIDRNGKIASKHLGFTPQSKFEEEIKPLLK